MLKLKNVNKKYGKINTINNVSIIIEKPGLYILTGENGSGKSTIIKLLSKIIYKSSGEIENNYNISYLPDKFLMPKLMNVKLYIKEMLKIYRNNKNVDELMQMYMLPKKRIGELSKGNLQKLGILQIVENDVKYYVFDEPLDGLDENARKLFKNIIIDLLAKEKVVIMSLHNKSLFNDLKPQIFKIKDGKIDNAKKKI